jgi:hypothetical protein
MTTGQGQTIPNDRPAPQRQKSTTVQTAKRQTTTTTTLATTRLAVGHHCNYSIRDWQWSWFTSFWRGIT